MTKDEALKLAMDWYGSGNQDPDEFERLILSIVAQPEQEPVAWLLTDKNINSLQVDSIQRLIDRLKHAHHTDIHVRINGHDEWFEADWLKHLTRTTPPQRKPLTDEAISNIWCKVSNTDFVTVDTHEFARAIEAAHGIKEKQNEQ